MKLAQQTEKGAETTKRLEGKVALVTGGSRGIGAAIAQRLAAEGATVAITYTKNKQAADEVVASLASTGSGALAYKADVSSPSESERVIEELKKSVGKLDIVINNAGVWDAAPLDKIDVAQYHRVFDVNVKGTVSTTLAALKLLGDGGRIINLSSVAADTYTPGFSIYAASKAAVDALTRIWAQELGPRGITVNGVAPGTTVTDMFNEAMPANAHQDLIDHTALRRLGTPEDIAAVVAFLASDDGRWVTGQTIRADGGITF